MKFFGLNLPPLTRKQALGALDLGPQMIFTPNPEILLEARKNPAFLQALQAADLLLPDGNGLLLTSTLKGWPRPLRVLGLLPAMLLFLFWKKHFKNYFPEVIHGSDFMKNVVEWAAQKGKSVYFLGAGPGIAEKTAAVFQQKYPQLKVAGFSGMNPGLEALELVQKSAAEVLFVAYGAPKQELWLAENRENLPQVCMAVGGSFDFWSGQVRRAPYLFRMLGLEWLWRLVLNPRVRLKRIWNAVVVFPVLAVFE